MVSFTSPSRASGQKNDRSNVRREEESEGQNCKISLVLKSALPSSDFISSFPKPIEYRRFHPRAPPLANEHRGRTRVHRRGETRRRSIRRRRRPSRLFKTPPARFFLARAFVSLFKRYWGRNDVIRRERERKRERKKNSDIDASPQRRERQSVRHGRFRGSHGFREGRARGGDRGGRRLDGKHSWISRARKWRRRRHHHRVRFGVFPKKKIQSKIVQGLVYQMNTKKENGRSPLGEKIPLILLVEHRRRRGRRCGETPAGGPVPKWTTTTTTTTTTRNASPF